MEFTMEQLMILKARKIAFPQGIAVVLGVIAIIVLADAMYKDKKFTGFVMKQGINWTGKVNNNNSQAAPINLRSITWIKDEKEQLRGELDWILLIGLMLVTLTHIALLIFLMFDIPSSAESKARRRGQLKDSVSCSSNLGERKHPAISGNMRMEERNSGLNAKNVPLVDPDDNENEIAASAVATASEDAADNNEPSSSKSKKQESSLTREDDHGAPKPNNNGKANGKEQMSLPDESHHPTSNFILEATKARRRWRCHASVIWIATLPMGIFTLFLIAGLCLEWYLVAQLNTFYKTTESPNETFPFPGICAMERIDEFRDYNRDKKDKYAWDFASHGACNDFLLKLSSIGISIGLVIISIGLLIAYSLRYVRLTRAESELFSVHGCKRSDSLQNLESSGRSMDTRYHQ